MIRHDHRRQAGVAGPGRPGARRQRDLRQRRAVRRAGEPDQAGGARRSGRTRSATRARSWTAGRRAAAGEPGSDSAIVRLGCGGVVRRVVVDTSWFTGNYPPEVSVEACGAEGYPSPAELAAAPWTTLVPRSAVAGDARNEFEVEPGHRATHVRLTIYPDGGVARLRVYGEPVPDPRLLPATIDLAALENGAVGDRLQQHVLLLPRQPAAARPGPGDGRRLGDLQAARPGERLGGGAAGLRRVRRGGRARHLALRRQRPGLGGAQRRRPGGARPCCPAPRCSRTPGTASPYRAGR